MGRRLLPMVAVSCLVLKGQEFEAASIKPSAPMTMGMNRVGVQMLPGGRVSMSGVTVKVLIQQAYGVRDFQIAGGPDWMGSDRYDITAKPEGAATPEQVKIMMQGLLADRFKLQFHRETKELPTYVLMVAKGGPKFHESAVVQEADKPKGARITMNGRGRVSLEGATVAAFANYLGQVLGRSVIDKTELSGNYDLRLEWTPDETTAGMMRGPGGDGPAPSDSAAVSIFTALQEQLGLKLESAKGPVELLVIERAEKASEN
jgi:bla regulator protein blaR1